MAQVVPCRGRASSDVASATGDFVACLSPALRGEKESGTGAECSAEQRAGGEEPDMLPIQLAVVRGPLLGGPRHAPGRYRELSFEGS